MKFLIVVMVVLVVGLILLIIFLLNYIIREFNKNKKFKIIKPGDKVLVTIYSEYCECERESNVIEKYENKIKARISEEVNKKCLQCSNFKAINEEGKNTCNYFVTEFSKFDVKKL